MNTNLVSIIKNSLAAAQAALDLIQVEQTATPLVSAAPAPAPAVMASPDGYGVQAVAPAANEYQATGFDSLMQELNDPRFTLRSTRELAEKTGVSGYLITGLLDDNGIEYITKRRRSDGAELIGLASRN
jgi:hypothetical protein